ncbi:hypothetical protein QBC46DRAFT_384252 [Diplogelasinospora grovesii]|uniref:Pentatricopeptide repeat domain-containing protein n=1 Tax=Diplogelasinospora grovesii TaxID=303347 RepID=A0AAN6N8L7_9PEZI|nr:hypothetical protein QBC46DRAFT_384252 [Diplogelasinospora grovesii]
MRLVSPGLRQIIRHPSASTPPNLYLCAFGQPKRICNRSLPSVRSRHRFSNSSRHDAFAAVATAEVIEDQGEDNERAPLCVRTKHALPELTSSAADDLCEPPLLDSRGPIPRFGDYGKWRRLSFLPQQLSYESDILSPDAGHVRLVDLPENENDIELWACILNYRHRKAGIFGVAAVLEGLRRRRTLREMSGEVAETFWQTILAEALHDERLLENVWEYAEWLYVEHRVLWPELYETTICYFTENRQTKEALRWHMRLSPHFGLDAGGFTKLFKRFITDPDRAKQYILRGLYSTSVHRELYDELVPYLYTHGTLALARKWRSLLLLHNDLPGTHASRPFLRFMAGYYPQVSMNKSELRAAGLGPTIPENDETDDAQQDSLRTLVNRVHGQTFGIREKTYNDELGARWFASSWVSLEFAIDAVRFLGVTQIGPLSLQSIALRETYPDRILDRIEQLRTLGISIGTSSYAQAIRHFAALHDHETISDLLHTDMHPDIFDDWETQHMVLETAASRGDWKRYRLMMAVRLAVSRESVASASNRLLVACLESGSRGAVLRILDDMTARGVQLFASSSDMISMHILKNVSRHAESNTDEIGFYAALCRRIMSMRFPLAASALQTILYRLGREGLLDKLQQLSIEIVQRYNEVRTSGDEATMNVHKLDVPAVVVGDDQPSHQDSSKFQAVPSDLSLRHPSHPIQLIFDKRLQQSIIRWGFRRALSQAPSLKTFARNPTQPEDFHMARGIRLLALLQGKGVVVEPDFLRKTVLLRLAELYWRTRLLGHAKEFLKRTGARRRAALEYRRLRSLRAKKRLYLRQAKDLCNEAWGSEVLPRVPELQDLIWKWGKAFIKRTKPWGPAPFRPQPNRRIRRPKPWINVPRGEEGSVQHIPEFGYHTIP